MAHHKDKIRMNSKDHVSGVPYVADGLNLCRLPDGLVCIGCCGFDFGSKITGEHRPVFLKALQQNTREFAQCKTAQEFKDLYPTYDLHDIGLCRRLVIKDDSDPKRLDIICPLHPLQNKGADHRRGECDAAYMCLAQRKFHTWPHQKRQEFVQFLMEKNMDWFAYSLGMYSDTLVREFDGER